MSHLVRRLPIGSDDFRLHALSALLHSLTVGVLALTGVELGASFAAALAGALSVGFGHAFFLGSLYAEAFPLDDLLAALVVCCALRARRAVQIEDARAFERALLGVCVCLGLGAAHHQLLSLTVPGALLLSWPGRKLARAWASPRALLVGLAALAFPALFFYSLLFFQARGRPGVGWGGVEGVSDLFAVATRRDYGGLLSPHLGGPSPGAGSELAAYGALIGQSLGPWGLAAGALGAFVLGRRAPREALALGLGVLLAGPVFFVLNALPVDSDFARAFAERFTTLSLVLCGPFLALGLARVEAFIDVALRRPLGAVVAGASFVLPLALNAGTLDLSRDDRGRRFADDLLRHTEDRALVLITGSAAYSAEQELCAAEQRCGNRAIFSPGQLHLAWKLNELQRRFPTLALPSVPGPPNLRALVVDNLKTRPVYLMPELIRHDASLAELTYLPSGLLVRALAPGEPAPSDQELEREARELLSCRELSGCRAPPERERSPLERPIRESYGAAFYNYANTLEASLAGDELLRALRERGHAFYPELEAER